MIVSVIIPTYRPGGYLYQCLDSILNQSLSHDEYEVIIVLNGDKDPFYSQITQFIKDRDTESCCRLLYMGEAGVSAARNLGIESAKGDYIAFVDDDDYVSSSYLKELYLKSSNNTIAISYPYAFVDGSSVQQKYNMTKVYQKRYKKGRQPKDNSLKFFSGPCMKLIHKSIIGDRRFDTSFSNGEDSIFMFTISDRIDYVDYTSPTAVYFRRFRIGSATHGRTRFEIFKNSLKMMKVFSEIYFSNTHGYSFKMYEYMIVGGIKSIIAG